MVDRWVTLARTRVPLELREPCFDPAIADLIWARTTALSSCPRWRRPVIHVRFLLHLAMVTMQCRRLEADHHFPRRDPMASSLLHIFLHATRRLLRQPRFTATVALTLALGLGANITVFSFVDAFLIAPLPVPHPEQVVRVGEVRDGEPGITSWPTYRDLSRLTEEVLDLAAHVQTDVQLGEGEAAHVGTAELVSGNYFRVTGLAPAQGRLLDESDNLTELGHPVAVVSDRYWRRVLGAAPDATGHRLRINGATFTIVGVAPAGFDGTYAAHHVDVWVPVVMQGWVRPRGLSIDRRSWGWLQMVGRLHGDADVAKATRAIQSGSEAINREFPPARSEDEVRFAVAPATALSRADTEALAPLLTMAFAFTALLFLATCANLTGLLQARLASRARELAIRQSLGGTRARLAAEWVIECLVLALLGGLLAFGIGVVGAKVLSGLDVPPELVGQVRLVVDVGWRALAYTLVVALAGACAIGIATAWQLGRATPVTTLKSESATQAGRAGLSRSRRVTVCLQVALSMVLLVVATLLVQSLLRQAATSPGFDVDRIGVMSLNLNRQRVAQADWPALIRTSIETARQVPGVTAAAVAMRPPLGTGNDVQRVRIPGYVPPDGTPTIQVDFNAVSPGYFDVLGLRLVAGSTWADDQPVAPSVVINETMAQRYWRGGDAVGKTVTVGRIEAAVIGVVADSSYYSVGEAPLPMMYVPVALVGSGTLTFLVRTTGDAMAASATTARALTNADARLAPSGVMAFNTLRQVPLFPTRVLSGAAFAFGAVSLLLTIVGLHGVIAGSVADRIRELGVRLALGATPTTIWSSVLREALALAVAGCAIGTVAAASVASAMRSWLSTVSPFEPIVYALVAAIIMTIAAVSAWPSARIAGRIDPVVVLR